MISPLLPEVELAKVRAYCAERLPEEMLEEARVEVDVACDLLTIVECRSPLPSAAGGAAWTRSPIAQLRWAGDVKRFSLWRRDPITEWRPYDAVEAQRHVNALLFEIEADPHQVFWT